MKPPKAALGFLRWFCREDFIDEVEGDLIELFEKDSISNPRIARWLFTWQVIKHFRPAFIKSFHSKRSPINTYMIQHILLVSFRNFMRQKQVFLINLLGLAAGLTSVLLIYLWVQDEISIDQFHENRYRLYQVKRHTPLPDGGFETHESNSVLLPDVLTSEITGVEYVIPMRPTQEATVSIGADRIAATGAFAGEAFFKAFSFPIIYGDAGSALASKYNMAISSDLAMRLFGTTANCLGKPVNWDLQRFGGDFVISAVFDKPANTSEQFDFLLSYEMFLEKNPMDVNWDSNPVIVNIMLREDVNVDEFNENLQALYLSKRFVDEKPNGDAMFLQKYADLYLHNRYENKVLAGGRIDYVILFSAVAMFILLIACINFMNLSTARAQTRMKEIGIKKGMGAQRMSLIFQHLGESTIIAMFALMVSIIVVILLLPEFNEISGKHLVLRNSSSLLLSAFIIAIVTGIAAGSYPALFLSGFKPAEILKGKFTSSKREVIIRKGLVVFQFSISIILIIGVVVVYRQLDYIQSRDLGYNKENIILIEKQGTLNNKLDEFLARARQTPGVLAASSVGSSVANNTNSSWGHNWEGQQPGGEDIQFSGLTVNYDFIEALGIEMKYGRSFSDKYAGEDSKVIINETAMKAMGITNPVGKWMELFGPNKWEIIGVVKDYHFQSLYSNLKPQFMLLGSRYTNTIVLKLANPAVLENIRALVKEFDPTLAFEFQFLDDEYRSLYASEQRVSKLARYFACIAIVLSCLGLFGMAAFSAERRSKEFSIRKVLGCTEWRIMRMLSFEFVSMVIVASLIAIPVGWYYSAKWLASFAYRSELSVWLMLATVGITLTMALITVSMYTIKAARINPAANLKTE